MLDNHDSASAFAPDTLQCTGLPEWNNVNSVMGLFIGNVRNATGNCHVLLSWSQCFQFSRKYNEKRREQNGASHINHLWNRFCICGSLCSILLLEAGVRSSKFDRQTKGISSDEHICRERGCFRSPKPCCTCRFHAGVLSFLFRDSFVLFICFFYTDFTRRRR